MIADRGIGDSVCFLTDVTGAAPSYRTIRDMMLLSDVVFVPSHEEGFGIPLREAATLRAPVLCSDIPVFREIAGRAARFFKLDDTDRTVAEMIVAIARSPENVSRREAVRSQREFERQIRELVD
jgi:glycosyltransferase involved in cell wall biosynthesis